MYVQFLQAWEGPRDAQGSRTVYPQGLSIEIDDGLAGCLAAVGILKPLAPLPPDVAASFALLKDLADECKSQGLNPTPDVLLVASANLALLEAEQAAQAETGQGEPAPAHVTAAEAAPDPVPELTYEPLPPEPAEPEPPAKPARKARR